MQVFFMYSCCFYCTRRTSYFKYSRVVGTIHLKIKNQPATRTGSSRPKDREDEILSNWSSYLFEFFFIGATDRTDPILRHIFPRGSRLNAVCWIAGLRGIYVAADKASLVFHITILSFLFWIYSLSPNPCFLHAHGTTSGLHDIFVTSYCSPCSLCFTAMVSARFSRASNPSFLGAPLIRTGSITSTLRFGTRLDKISTVLPPQP